MPYFGKSWGDFGTVFEKITTLELFEKISFSILKKRIFKRFLAPLPKSKFIATLFSKTIDFDQPFENAPFQNGKMIFSQKAPKLWFFRKLFQNPLMIPQNMAFLLISGYKIYPKVLSRAMCSISLECTRMAFWTTPINRRCSMFNALTRTNAFQYLVDCQEDWKALSSQLTIN